MHVCVRILRSQTAVLPCALFLPFTYVHVVAFLGRSHTTTESGQGGDKATGNTKPSRQYVGSGGHHNETEMALCRWISSCCCL